MPDIEFIRAEIEHMRTQVGRQRKEILQLQRAGIPTASADILLGRMLTKIDNLLHSKRHAQERTAGPHEGQSIKRPAVVMRWYQDDAENPPLRRWRKSGA
jgi:hypothetical protein